MQLFRQILFALLLISSIGYAQNTPWQWQNPKPIGADYYEVIMRSQDLYFLFGNGGTVTRTSDGGSTWQVKSIDSLERNIYAAVFSSDLIGYVSGSGGMIYKTTDGGETWTEQQSGTTQSLWGITFVSADTGFAVGGAGALLITYDGGTTWTSANYGTATNYVLTFRTPTEGYLGSSSATTGRFIKTTDRGVTWQDVSTLLSGNTGAVRSIKFLNQSIGLVSTSFGLIYRTTDGGLTWNQVYTIGTPTATIFKVAYGNYPNFYASSTTGRMLRSTDGGDNWLLEQTASRKGLYSFDALGVNSIAAGDAGTILKSTDNGVSYSSIVNAASHEQLQRGSFPSALIGYVVGGSISTGNEFGDILKTTDGGNTWTKLPFSPETRVYSVCFLNELTGYVGVEGPTGMHKTTDGGQTWTALNTNTGVTGSIIYDIDFMDNNKGFAAYSSGQIARTTDGGNTWTAISAGFGSAACYDIFIVNPTIIYALGPGGRVSKSIDGGNSFGQLPTLGTPTLYSMHFFNADTGIIVGSSGKIWKTENGSSFTEIASPVTTTIYVVRFVNSQVGWFGASGGGIYYTLDGGISWTQKNAALGSSQSTREIQIKGSYLWVIGTDGMILKGFADPSVPVELTSFFAEASEAGVRLNWNTASEINNSGFEIQRLESGNTTGEVGLDEEWNTIGFVEGKGTTTQTSIYSFTDGVPKYGINYYRLKQIDFDGSFTYTDRVEINMQEVKSFALHQNYPNPFNPTTKISYQLPAAGYINITLYNTLGEQLMVLVSEEKPAGYHELILNGSALPAGVYFYRLQAGAFTETKKLLLLK